MIITLSIIAFLLFTVIFGRFADQFLFEYYPKHKHILDKESYNHPDPNFGRRAMVTFTIMIYGLILLITYFIIE